MMISREKLRNASGTLQLTGGLRCLASRFRAMAFAVSKEDPIEIEIKGTFLHIGERKISLRAGYSTSHQKIQELQP